MTEKELHTYLISNFPKEDEKCEWKEFKSLKNAVAGRSGDDMISYISAIANMQGGYLIIGVKDKTLEVLGIQDFADYNIDNIKFRIAGNVVNLNVNDFRVQEIVTSDSKKAVWIFHIPRHQYRLPVYAHKKAWQRIDGNLIEMTAPRLDAILTEMKIADDWTAVVLPEATLKDLDKRAIEKARIEFAKRNPKYAKEVSDWDDAKFLNKAKLTIRNGITRAALILLGKEESEHLLGSFVKIRWNLKTVSNEDKDFEIFSIPFILAVDDVYAKIRNLKYRYLKEGTLFPEEILRYDPFSIREPLNNAIAHQDYTKGARINVVEFEDNRLVFSNYGSFLPKSVEGVVLNDAPEEVYRNPFLVEAMKNLDMIETQGGGIRKIFNFQKQRLFPLPDYDLSNGKVKVTITGHILNEEFARILIRNPNLSLEEIIMLDKVQKRREITDREQKHLRKLHLIEGRKPNFFLSFNVIEPLNSTQLKAEYLANRSFDDAHFKDMIFEYIKKFGKVPRKEIDSLIIPKLSAALNDSQKKNKVRNFLSALRMEGRIRSIGKHGPWEII
ncbi:MAG: putative DNA binding domain-containing protein [Niabella sp.]